MQLVSRLLVDIHQKMWAIFNLFKIVDEDEASIARLLALLDSAGLRENDLRLKPMMRKIREYEHKMHECVDVKRYRLPRAQFKDCIRPSISLINKVLANDLVVPNWREFTEKISDIFEQCQDINLGEVATYIPQLARQDRDKWGLSICTIDGQRFSLGDSKAPFCFQSVSKAFNYAIVSSDLGTDYVHRFVGHEPSGRLFNEICLDADNKPHNPMINSGAIITTSLMKRGICMADRYEFAYNEYKKLSGNEYIGFNNSVFLSERETAARNFSLAFFLKEHKCFPPGIDTSLRNELDFYFQLCSLETHCDSAAVMAATFANGGVCPLTHEVCITPGPCRDVLSLMYSCGLYDFSGQFAFKVGLPAKSGVSGGMIVVIPNLMGICLYSPPLDKLGNTCRGVAFCQKLIDTFNFHNYDSLLHGDAMKTDPRRPIGSHATDIVVSLLFACRNGDFEAVRRLYIKGEDLNCIDYDGRSALHVAASEGHDEIVKFLLKCGVNADHKDRWGRTALEDANHFNHHLCASLLIQAMKQPSGTTSLTVIETDDRKCGVMMLENRDKLVEENAVENHVKHREETEETEK
ncbi:Ankyrin and Glutaminase domain containing protein [Aphelenchoides besseyi]|nr:Ankyrin and Glutaminase domain containing protein [Aphelenchoides besseyi]